VPGVNSCTWRHMRLSSLPKALALIAVLHAALPCATRAQLSSADRQHILTDNFTIIMRVSAIPEHVLKRLKEMTKSEGVLFAEPGADYQVTDAILNTDLPGRRLLFAGVSKEYCFIHYEKGGIAHTYYVILFRISNDGATFEWGARSHHEFNDLGELKKAIAANRLSENPGGWW
jgi:hypothetical protein